MLTPVLQMAIIYLCSCNRVMECPHLILIEISFYSNSIYIRVHMMGTLQTSLIRSSNIFLNRNQNLLYLYLFFSFWGKKIIFPPNIIVTFTLKKIERKDPSSAVFLCCSPFQAWALVGKLITFCGYSRWQLQWQNTDVCLRSWDIGRKQIWNAKWNARR